MPTLPISLALLLLPFTTLAASISLGQVSSTGVTATITPDTAEIGSNSNIYLAAVLNGRIDLRGSGAQDWLEYSGGAYRVALPNQSLGASTSEPTTWKNSGYDTGAKEGYFNNTWNSAAKLIWTSDLQADNTLLCKVTVTGK